MGHYFLKTHIVGIGREIVHHFLDIQYLSISATDPQYKDIMTNVRRDLESLEKFKTLLYRLFIVVGRSSVSRFVC